MSASPGIDVMIAIPLLRIGGTEVQTLSLVKALVAGGGRVALCCYYEYDESMVEEVRAAGAEVTLLKLKRGDGLFALVGKLKSSFRRTSPAVVHVQYIAPGLAAVLAARLAGVRNVFATVHIAGRSAYGLKAKLMLRFAALFCRFFFCVSRGVEEFWFGDSVLLDGGGLPPGRRHGTVYNAIDVERIARAAAAVDRKALRESLRIGADQPVVGSVGRLSPQKGYDVLLRAWKEVRAKAPEAVLVVVGEGPERAALERQADRLGVASSIRWPGEVDRSAVPWLYPVMDVFVMPSRYEGFGLTAGEAMAAGLPVIGARVEGLVEVIEEGVTGCLVPPGDAAALAGELTGLLADRDRAARMGEAGRERVRRCFSLARYGDIMRSAHGMT